MVGEWFFGVAVTRGVSNGTLGEVGLFGEGCAMSLSEVVGEGRPVFAKAPMARATMRCNGLGNSFVRFSL